MLRNQDLQSGSKVDILLGEDTDGSLKIKELEKLVRLLKQEKDDAVKEKVDTQEKLKLQEKATKEALSQRKLAMTEYTEVTDK